MTITQLRYIVAVDNHRHFAKAAEASFVTQPTLSMQIQKLEEELDILIFDRSKQPIVPTPLGARIIEQARKVIYESEVLENMAKQIKGSFEGELSIGVIPTIAPSLLARFIPEFTTKYPQLRLRIEELKTEDMIEALRQDRIDVGIAATPLEEKGIVETPIYYEPFMAFVPEYHKFADDEFLLASELNANELLLLNEGHCFRNSVLKLCQTQLHPNQRVQMESGNFDTLIKLAHRGMGMTLLPYLTAIDLSEKYRPFIKPIAEPTPSREVSLLYARTQLKQEWIKALADVIKSTLPEKVLHPSGQVVSPSHK
jgi:LysR family hydrogen peroxide-inducible transcriptional activator